MNSSNNYYAQQLSYNQQFSHDFDNYEDYNKFNDKVIRRQFILKVLGILCFQLSITLLFILFSIYNKDFAYFQRRNIYIFYFCIIANIVMLIVISFMNDFLKKVPQNYVFLTVFTVFESYAISNICAFIKPFIVLNAILMTISITVFLMIYASKTDLDFTVYGSALYLGTLCLMLFGFFALFTSSNLFHIIVCIIGVFLYGLYVVYDFQLLLNNKEVGLSIDDYILGAFMLYIDIIQLFLCLLELIQRISSDN